MTQPARSAWLAALHGGAAVRPLFSWLRERDSLTARLRRCCQQFSVRCLSQGLAPLHSDEACALNVPPGQQVWTREVLLLTDGQPAVFAHTVMPYHPRHPFDMRFSALGQHSLGSLLFSDPRIARGPLEFRHLDQRHVLYQRAAAALGQDASPVPARLWARRSHFGPQAKGVLVTEVFLPHIRELQPDSKA